MHWGACTLDLPVPTARPALRGNLCFPCELHALFTATLGPGGSRAVTPRRLGDALCHLGPLGRFTIGRQEDAQEFLVHLLDACEIASLERARLLGVSNARAAAGLARMRESVARTRYGSIGARAIAALCDAEAARGGGESPAGDAGGGGTSCSVSPVGGVG